VKPPSTTTRPPMELLWIINPGRCQHTEALLQLMGAGTWEWLWSVYGWKNILPTLVQSRCRVTFVMIIKLPLLQLLIKETMAIRQQVKVPRHL
jgi:hypothetical protein